MSSAPRRVENGGGLRCVREEVVKTPSGRPEVLDADIPDTAERIDERLDAPFTASPLQVGEKQCEETWP
jgi:hypothetical protein